TKQPFFLAIFVYNPWKMFPVLLDLTQINWKFLKVQGKCLKTCGTAGVTYNFGVFMSQKTRKLPLRH
ncbi:MAG: hypothetical protein KAR13_03210, partial [Desulfobulbaceae bacterium]|nr:hypothetical protein [Desulfobulbaceae bacterium]